MLPLRHPTPAEPGRSWPAQVPEQGRPVGPSGGRCAARGAAARGAAARGTAARGAAGQALPLVLVVMIVCGAAAVLVARYGALVVNRARAEAAADAVALACATRPGEGRAVAARVAAANGARLVDCRESGPEVVATVVVGQVRGTARALRLPEPLDPPAPDGSSTDPVRTDPVDPVP